ncbi:MAG: LysR family transcriptional regulator [Desulfobacterales bacterium]|nr:LysR family transcriptional regulator [Desulfobacterales bacterium]
MQIDALRTFVNVMETGSFTRAAHIVNLTQAAVSLQIKRLENELETPLFVRIAKTVKPTNAAKALEVYARQILRNHDEAMLVISQPELSGTIRFGCPYDYSTPFISEILSRFARKHPKVVVHLHMDYSKRLWEDVRSAEMDFALCSEMIDGGEVIFREPLVWISSPTFQQHKQYPLPLASSYEGCAYQKYCLQALEEARMEYQIKYVTSSTEGTASAVRAGLAVGVTGISNIPPGLIRVGKENHFPELPQVKVGLHKAPGTATPLSLAFESCIRKTFTDLSRDMEIPQ